MIVEPYKFVAYEYTARNRFQIGQGYHPFDSLYVLQSGAFVSKSNGITHTYKSGDVVFFPTDLAFERFIVEPLAFHFILFERNRDSEARFALPSGKLEFRDQGRLHSTLQAFRSLSSISRDFNAVRQHLLNDIVYQYYIETHTACDHAGIEMDDPVLVATVNYMRNNIARKLNLQQLAAYAGMTPSGLIWKFKTNLGTSPIDYLIALRIELAQRLLRETEMSMQKIAEQCGFDNGYYFSSAFKKRMGLPPSLYRASHRI